jgi:hypothetical protein
MATMKLPADLLPAHWDKHKGVIAKTKATGVGEALRDLGKAHDAIDFALFDDIACKTAADAESRLALLEAHIAKALQSASARAAEVASLARKAEAEFKSSKLIPKTATAAAAAVVKAADAYVVDLARQAAAAQAALRKSIATLKAAEAKSSGADEAEEANLEKLKAGVISAMRLAKKAQGDPNAKPVNFMIAAKDKTLMAFVTPKSVGETQKKVLKKLIGSESGVKFYAGQVGFDLQRKAWMFEGESIPTGGFAKKLQTGLKDLTGTGYKLCVRRPGGETEEVDGVSDDEAPDTGALPGALPGNQPGTTPPSDGDVAKALLARLAEMQDALARAAPAGSERAGNIAKAQQQAKAAVLAMQLADAKRLVATLEALLKAPPQGASANPAIVPKGQKAPQAEPTGAKEKPPAQDVPTKPAPTGDQPEPGPRETARAETDAVLSQVTALVLGGIVDDALRKAINDKLAVVKAGFDKADQMPDAKNATAGFRAVKVKADALLVQAQAAKDLADFLAAQWAPAAKAAADAVAALTAAGAKAVLQARVEALQGERDRAVAAGAIGTLKDALAGLQKAKAVADAVATGAQQADTQIAAAAQSIAAMGADASGPLQETLADLQKRRGAADWPGGATVDALDGAIATFAAEVKRLTDATAEMRKLFDQKQEYEKAFAALKARHDWTVETIANSGALLLAADVQRFETAEKGRTDAVDAREWLLARGAVTALTLAIDPIEKAVTAYLDFDDERTARAGEITAAKAHCYGNAGGMADPESTNFWTAQNAMDAAVRKRDWKTARAELDKLVAASKAVTKVATAGKAYYDEFDKIRPIIYKAYDAARAAKSGTLPARAAEFTHLFEATRKLAAAKSWKPAVDSLVALKKAADDLLAAQKAFDIDKAPFDTAFVKITEDLARARSAAAVPPKKLKGAQVKDFREKFAVVNDARNAGRFGEALAALPALEAAIRALLEAKAKWDAERGAYQTAVDAILRLPEARRLAEAAPAAMAEAAGKFQTADAAVNVAVRAEDWKTAEGLVKALQAATTGMLDAKDQFNATAGTGGVEALRKRVAALKGRTDKAGEDKVPLFVDHLQRAVRDRLDDIERWIAAPDLAAAEVSFGHLVPELDAMDQGKAAWAAHRTRYEAARDGDVKKARDAALQPPALAGARDAAFKKTEEELALLVDKKQLAAADARVARWVLEAKAWLESKAAYDALAGGAPTKETLKKLGDQPGGGEVLDALVTSLPPETTQKVMSTALEARFGFTVKRFEKANEKASDLTGVKALSPDAPDKSLQQTYKVLAAIPESHLKGKVTELIAFDASTGGAMFSNTTRKIYMYCGRPDDAGEKTLGDAKEIVPEGETVDPRCLPANKEPVQEFDHALLHEAGHGQDLATKTMVDKDGKNDKAFGAWILHKKVDEVATEAAAHFKVDFDYVLATLQAPGAVPPELPKLPKGGDKDAWETKHKAAADWCRLVRVDNELWNKPGLSKQLAIGGRTYQEAYAGRWVSYDVSTRSQGISAYQFRSEWEWFAELYAAYFCGKLQPSHPACEWLDKMKTPA